MKTVRQVLARTMSTKSRHTSTNLQESKPQGYQLHSRHDSLQSTSTVELTLSVRVGNFHGGERQAAALQRAGQGRGAEPWLTA